MKTRFKRSTTENEFIHGIVAALDVVALYDYGACFKGIVESAGKNEVLIEIQKNGLERTKAMANAEFIHA